MEKKGQWPHFLQWMRLGRGSPGPGESREVHEVHSPLGDKTQRKRCDRLPALHWNKQHGNLIMLKTLSIKIYGKQSQTLEWGNSLPHPRHMYSNFTFNKSEDKRQILVFNVSSSPALPPLVQDSRLLTRQLQVPPHSSSAPRLAHSFQNTDLIGPFPNFKKPTVKPTHQPTVAPFLKTKVQLLLIPPHRIQTLPPPANRQALLLEATLASGCGCEWQVPLGNKRLCLRREADGVFLCLCFCISFF